jgi:putative membrane protein
MTTSDLPALNACLNATSATLLIIGYFQIRNKKILLHRLCMSAAFLTSVLFLGSYLYYHYHHGSTSFQGPSGVRMIYLAILLTHTVLAIVIVPMILLTFQRALKGEFGKHRSIARWTLPFWLYVSVTGVIVYLMLYQLYPAR